MIDSAADLELIVIDQASKALAEAESLSEIKTIRDKAEAVRKYAASAALGLSAQNYAAEVKLRAERKAGVLLSKMRLRGGDRKSNEHDARLKLDDLGISQSQSSRWQLQARLPIGEFEQYMHATREAGREISTTTILRLARAASQPLNGRKHRSKVRNATRKPRPRGEENDSTHGSPMEEGLVELSHHRDLLDEILKSVYTGHDEELRPAQRRVLGDILRDMESLLRQLRQLARLHWNQPARQSTSHEVFRPIEIIAKR